MQHAQASAAGRWTSEKVKMGGSGTSRDFSSECRESAPRMKGIRALVRWPTYPSLPRTFLFSALEAMSQETPQSLANPSTRALSLERSTNCNLSNHSWIKPKAESCKAQRKTAKPPWRPAYSNCWGLADTRTKYLALNVCRGKGTSQCRELWGAGEQERLEEVKSRMVPWFSKVLCRTWKWWLQLMTYLLHLWIKLWREYFPSACVWGARLGHA